MDTKALLQTGHSMAIGVIVGLAGVTITMGVILLLVLALGEWVLYVAFILSIIGILYGKYHEEKS